MAKDTLNLEVKSNIKSVTKDTDDLGKSLGKTVDETKDLGTGLEDAGSKGKKGFALVTGGVKAFGLALKAAGIGLVIAILASLKEALERNQKVMNAVNTIMTTISTTFNQVVDVLTETYNWVTKSSERFDGLTKVIEGLMTLALTPLKLAFYSIKLAIEGLLLAWEDSFLGGGDEARIIALSESIRGTADDIKAVGQAAIDAGKDIGKNIGDAIGEIGDIGTQAIKGISKVSITSNYEMAKATTAAANSSKLAEAQIQGLIEKNDLLAETQRQIRDDETKTFAERIEANEKIATILDKQEKEMLKLADTRVAAAALELAANKTNIDLQVAYQATLNDRAGVEAQVAGFRSEQLTNEVSLQKELGEVQREIAQDSIEGIERELLELKNAYELKLDMARKAGVSNLELTEQYEKEEQAIKDSYAATKKAKDDATAKADKDRDKAVNDAKVGMAKSTLGIIGEIAGEGTALAKGTAIAQATISGIEGVQNAYTTAQKSPYTLVFPGYPLVQAGLAAVFSALQIKKIASASSSSSGADSGGGAPSASASPPAPEMMSGAFELSGGQEVEPVQAYVVSDNITDSQNGLAIIRRRATI